MTSPLLASPLAASAVVCPTGQTGIIGAITEWLVGMMNRVGGPGVGLAIALESIFPPIPSEVILPLAGFTASQGRLALVEAIVWATIGSLVGAWVLYGLARWVGITRIHRAADVVPGVSRADVHRASRWFDRYGAWSVLIGRVIPVVRSLISIPAGFNAMNLVSFSLWTLLGSFVWNTLLVGIGYGLGGQWCSILGVFGAFENVVIAAAALVLLWLVWRWVRTVVVTRRSGQGQAGRDDSRSTADGGNHREEDDDAGEQ